MVYCISVEARLTGPAENIAAAKTMVANYRFERPTRRYTGPQFNISYAAIDLALERVVTDDGCGIAGGTLNQGSGNIQRSTIDTRDLIDKSLLRPIADLAQNILLNTGCTLNMVVTQVTGPGAHTISRIITHTIHPAIVKYHRVLRETITPLPTLGVEG